MITEYHRNIARGFLAHRKISRVEYYMHSTRAKLLSENDQLGLVFLGLIADQYGKVTRDENRVNYVDINPQDSATGEKIVFTW